MRTTLTIDEDVFKLTRGLAEARLSELAPPFGFAEMNAALKAEDQELTSGIN